MEVVPLVQCRVQEVKFQLFKHRDRLHLNAILAVLATQLADRHLVGAPHLAGDHWLHAQHLRILKFSALARVGALERTMRPRAQNLRRPLWRKGRRLDQRRQLADSAQMPLSAAALAALDHGLEVHSVPRAAHLKLDQHRALWVSAGVGIFEGPADVHVKANPPVAPLPLPRWLTIGRILRRQKSHRLCKSSAADRTTSDQQLQRKRLFRHG
mmetsp:Transcript_127821/g.408713  ORF Transcript_127821/g.408713 Transcript_127821/m.408713 type:complete len:212 (-) Transcript_127821:358-993(-)